MDRRAFLKLLVAAAAVTAGGGAGGYAFLQKEMFGALPDESMSERFARSAQFRKGEFHNLTEYPVLTGSSSVIFALFRSLTAKRENPRPSVPVPVKTDAFARLPFENNFLVWLGHSSFFLRLGGKSILLDPVLSPHASPMPFAVRAFEGATPYGTADFGQIDYVLVSHDHWDHLDYPTMQELRPKLKKVVCPLGTGMHLRRWGFKEEQIAEGDWWDCFALENMRVCLVPAQHFSGRTLVRNKALWCGFVVESEGKRIFFSGDSGYGEHFMQIGRKFGRMDAALLDSGQYNKDWPYVHMTPEQAARAAEDLNASFLLPMHIGKFTLAYHPWHEPFERIVAASSGKNYALLTPCIGEKLLLDALPADFVPWWRECL